MDLDTVARDLRRTSGEPLYRGVASALRQAIARGEVGPGARLPSERALARQLGLSRTTVVGAYRLLRDDGLVAGRRGGGTRVLHDLRVGPAVPPSTLAAGKLVAFGADVVDLSGSVIRGPRPPALDQAVRAAARGVGPGGDADYQPLGVPALRRAIADRCTDRGTPTSAESVVVTSGAQQAVSLVLSLFARDGGTIAFETPTYAGAIDAARAGGARTVTFPSGDAGPRPTDLREVLGAADPALVYLLASPHNPTGALVPPRRRDELLGVCSRAGVPVVEDEALADLAPPGPTGRRAPDVTIGSLDKTCWPGLRIGWLRASDDVVTRLARLKVVTDLGTSEPSQALAHAIVPRLDEIAAHRREQLEERRAVLCDLLATYLPDWSFSTPPAGMFLWARIPHGDARVLSDLALAHGVAVLPGARTDPDRGTSLSDRLRISCTAEPADLVTGVRRLATAWAQHRASTTGEADPLGVVV